MKLPQRIGQQLGNYRLTRLLGTGGFAEVYLGEHVHLGTDAAIKVLHTRVEQEDAAAFGDEARTIARLRHAHIVRVLDFGLEGALPYLVMDYAPQGSLRSRHARGTQLPLEIVRSYVQQLAGALQYAHERKLIHRDLKPENILVDESGELMLSDFGIATVAQSSRSQNTQDIVGTAAYMAPEQLQGKPRPARDQYSFGIMVYEWLTGTRPFQGTFTEIASQHLLTPPPPLQEKRRDLPRAVEQVILTALQKDPHQRFGSVKAFATAFEQACEQSAQNEHEVAVETQRSSISPNRIYTPPSQDISDAPVKPVSTIESVETPPAVQAEIAPTREVISSRSFQSQPPLSSLNTPSSEPFAWWSVNTKSGLGQGRAAYAFLVGILLVIMVVAGILIYQYQQRSVVTVGNDITSIQVGTGFDSTTGQIINPASSFHQGDTIYLVSDVTSYVIRMGGISDMLLSPSGTGVQQGSGAVDAVHNVYYNYVVARLAGIYTWSVLYDGGQEASITFQVS